MDILRRRLPVFAIWAAAAAVSPAQDNLELGKMWTFENPPLAYLQKEYGFEPDRKWLDSLRLASLRFGGGCSASFVSPKGLIMTNHHCARGHIARVSPPGEDWVRDGFYARSLEEEVKLPGLAVQQLVRMIDVTERMNRGVYETLPPKEAAAVRRKNQAEILDEARHDHPNLRPQVVKLHQGAVFQLYLYKVWDDIRLVCSPHLQIAYFGGDPDNFTYPRYDIDFTFCRAYEDGKPADTSGHYFRWRAGGAKEGELVFVTGNPGSTGRLLTRAQLEYLRDAQYPIVRELVENRLAIMKLFAAQDPETERRLRTRILQYENARKAYKGYHEGLLDDGLMQRKAKAEEAFRKRVAADPVLAKRFGDVWDKLAAVAARATLLEPRIRFHTTGGSPHLTRALHVVRAAVAEDAERRRRHRERAMATKLETDAVAKAFFVDHLRRAGRWLPADDPFRKEILEGRDPEEVAAAIARSRVADETFVVELIQGGSAAVAASDDPAVRAARVLLLLMREDARMSADLAADREVYGTRIGLALFAVYGNKISPDATFTLRFSDGLVKGYPYNGTIAPPRTCFYGLYGRSVEFDRRSPFDLPEIWLQREKRVEMTKSVDFVSTNDIIGGNSGSPVVDKELRVVGLIFDGNIEMLPNRFLYSDKVARAVSVHVDGIMEALTKIYDADRVVKELRAAAER